MKTIVTITITEYQALFISSRFKWCNKQVFQSHNGEPTD